MKKLRVIVPFILMLVFLTCDSEDHTVPFTIYISNQSFEIDLVDIQVEIDGEMIFSDDFHVGDQHDFEPFGFTITSGKHRIDIWSEKGRASFSEQFELDEEGTGIIMYWFYSQSSVSNQLHFTFSIQKGPPLID